MSNSTVLTKGPSSRSIEPLTTIKRSEKDIIKFDKDTASSEVNYFQGSNLSLRAINVINNGQLEEVGVYIRTEFGGSIRYTFTAGN
jgi:hypothetical protein